MVKFSNACAPCVSTTKLTEMEMMKERFAKLLLGEDMSGSGKGVCTALAISNAITNLCGQNSPPGTTSNAIACSGV